MKSNDEPRAVPRWLFLVGAVACSAATHAASTAEERQCGAHAAAMVAEMKAASETALGADELSLVRRTAFKSCMAQFGAGAAVAPAAAADERVAGAADAAEPEPEGTWDSLKRLLDTDAEKTAGHRRLQRRSGGGF